MTPATFTEARQKLGLSAQGMARACGFADGRTIRRVETGVIAVTKLLAWRVEALLADPSLVKEFHVKRGRPRKS